VREAASAKSAGTIPEMFFTQARLLGSQPAFLHKVSGEYRSVSYLEAETMVRETAAGLIALGIKAGERVALMSYNRLEWAVADLAILAAGGVNVPIYHGSTRAQADRILQRAGVRTAFVSRSEKAEMLLTCDASLETMIALDPGSRDAPGPCAMDFAGLRARGAELLRERGGADLEERLRAVSPGSPATIVFTSGTTGEPKGVMLSHRNLLSNAEAGLAAQPVGKGDLYLSFLPLSHLFERSTGYYLMVMGGVPIAYAESVRSVADDARQVRPTVMLAVPRFLEKVQEKVMDGVRSASLGRRVLFHVALAVGGRMRPKSGPGGWLVGVADRMVLHRIRAALGGRLRFVVCGGAPLAASVVEFFHAAGIEVIEGYGLSEASPVISVNRLGMIRPGTVGFPLENLEVRILSDGEIAVKGPSVMLGYLDNPEATGRVVRDGWLHTGDTGLLEDGYLRITGRKKDIIVTSGGKNVAPQKIENLLEEDECIAQAVVYGDRRKFLTALIVPDYPRLRREMKDEGLERLSDGELAERDDVTRFLMERVKARSKELASYQRVRRIAVLPEGFSEERGEVTSTMKVRRDQVTKDFRERLDTLYE
jgi:long-chain acyl-CoA synthetase